MNEEMNKPATKLKNEFLFNMSHDIRTPLTAILGYTAMLLKRPEDTTFVEDCATKINSSGSYLLALIDDLLEIAKIENGQVTLEAENVDLTELMEELKSFVVEKAEEKNLFFSCRISSEIKESVWTDRTWLMRVLMNVVTNAIKYTKSGGRVFVELEKGEALAEDKSYFVFRINDTGIGMSKKFQEHIFDQFSRERNATSSGIQGTGLGMAICKTIVDRMGGEISVDSVLGKGTTVTIKLPLLIVVEEAVRPVQTNAEKTRDVGLEGMRILVAEDNELNREVITFMLEDMGAEVTACSDGSEAVNIVREAAADTIDVILMDIQMPYMDGYKATEIIRHMVGSGKEHLPIYALSANAFREDIERSLKNGMNGHLSKPIDPVVLKDTLVKYARKKSLAEVVEKPQHFVEESEPKLKPVQAQATSDRSILIVDDSRINRLVLAKILRQYAILEAENGSEALKLLQELDKKPDLILLDVSMPVMNGFEFMEVWRQDDELNAIPIIVETTGDTDEAELSCLKAGATDIVKKPFNSEIINLRVQNVLDKRCK